MKNLKIIVSVCDYHIEDLAQSLNLEMMLLNKYSDEESENHNISM